MGLRLLKAKRALLGFYLEEVTKVSNVLNLNLEEVNDIFLHINLPKGNIK